MKNLNVKPVVLVILDGYGFSQRELGNAVWNAKTPYLDEFIKSSPHTLLNASGSAVGLPRGQIGNSEVGHLHLGAGRTVYMGLMLINKAIDSGDFDRRQAFENCLEHVKHHNSKLHILGLLSPGGVHSHEKHIFQLIELAGNAGVDCVVHVFCDGRDVPPKSVIDSLVKLNELLVRFPKIHIGTISGRYYAMDRDCRWERSSRYYDALVSGIGNKFTDVFAYVKQQYANNLSDEFIEPAVNASLTANDLLLQDNDGVIFANFRPDRARQLSHLIFGSGYYDYQPKVKCDNLFFVTMMKYEGINCSAIAFESQILNNTMGKYLSELGYSQLRIAETEKYAHVTFFFDGGEELTLPRCHKIMIPSKKVATYDLDPAMSCGEIVDKLVTVINKFDFVIVNFANPDMVGHSGNYEQTIAALQFLDEQINRLLVKVAKLGGVVFLTSDHGNAEEMLTLDLKPVTSHTTNPVYFVCSDRDVKLTSGDLGNVAPTILDYVGLEIPKEMTKKSLLCSKK